MLDFQLDSRSGVPFYRQIIDQIRFGMATDKVKVGDQLPTVRALAVQLKVNLNTVTKAYKELEIQKILETQQGTGTFIGSVKVTVSAKEKILDRSETSTAFPNVLMSLVLRSFNALSTLT